MPGRPARLSLTLICNAARGSIWRDHVDLEPPSGSRISVTTDGVHPPGLGSPRRQPSDALLRLFLSGLACRLVRWFCRYCLEAVVRRSTCLPRLLGRSVDPEVEPIKHLSVVGACCCAIHGGTPHTPFLASRTGASAHTHSPRPTLFQPSNPVLRTMPFHRPCSMYWAGPVVELRPGSAAPSRA